MNAVDTNILLYVHDPRDPAKQAAAASLVESLSDGVLLWQVACEYIAASRKFGSLGYGFAEAAQDVQELRRLWHIVLPSWNSLDRANQLMGRLSLSFWDALLIGCCIESSVERLYSEDFHTPAEIEGLRIVNPFRDA